MLTKSQYEELLKYRGDGEKYDRNITEPLRFLIRKKYVVIYNPVLSGGEISDTAVCVITEIGKDALAEYERAEDKMRQQKADKESEKKSDRKFQIINTLFGAIVGAVITLLIEHRSCVFDFFFNLFS